jgi:hypothetical protein
MRVYSVVALHALAFAASRMMLLIVGHRSGDKAPAASSTPDCFACSMFVMP